VWNTNSAHCSARQARCSVHLEFLGVRGHAHDCQLLGAGASHVGIWPVGERLIGEGRSFLAVTMSVPKIGNSLKEMADAVSCDPNAAVVGGRFEILYSVQTVRATTGKGVRNDHC